MTTVTPELLLAEHDFVRGLARALLGREDEADEVAQGALLVALERAPERLENVRGWLRRVVESVARDRRKVAGRRRRREAVAARPERVPSAADVLAREEVRARVVRAVLELEEPYRGAVLLHYWDGLAPAQIAERLGVPGATVRSWLRRGRFKLREQLDRDATGTDWRCALAPLAGVSADLVPGAAAGSAVAAGGATSSGGAALVAATGGVLFSQATTKVCVAAAALVLIGLALWRFGGAPGPVVPGPGSQTVSPITVANPGERDVAEPAEEPGAAGAPAVADPARQDVGAVGRFEVSGVVREDRRVASGVRLELCIYDGLGTAGEPAVVVPIETSGDGRFEWSGTVVDHARTVTVVGRDPRWRVWSGTNLVRGGAVATELAVSATALSCRVHGVVRDGGGNPVARAAVLWNGSRIVSAETGPDGVYALHVGTGPNSRPLLVAARGLAPRLVPLEIPAGTTEWPLDVALELGRVARGRVIDAAGNPVAGASVTTSIGHAFEAVTDVDGRFELAALPARATLGIEADAGLRGRGSTIWSTNGGEIEIVLAAGVTVSGRALDAEGEPVFGVALRITDEMGNRTVWTGYTDEQGEFSAPAIPLGGRRLRVTKVGFVPQTLTLDVAEGMESLDLRMLEGVSVRGRVLDETGAPLRGASVYAQIVTDLSMPRSAGTRDDSAEDGTFRLDDLPRDERVTVYAWHDGYIRGSVADVDAERVGDLEIQLERAAEVFGKVLDARTGSPVAQFELTTAKSDSDLDAPWATVVPVRDGEGAFRLPLPSMKAGAVVHVQVQAVGYAPQRLTAVAGARGEGAALVVALRPGVTLFGVVRDAVTNRPMPGVGVRCQRSGEMFRSTRAPAVTTDAMGAYEIADVAPGLWQLVVVAEGRPDSNATRVDVTSGGERLEVNLISNPGGALAGRLVGFDHLVGRSVQLYLEEEPRTVGTAQVGPNGAFRFESVGVGRHYIVLPLSGRAGYVGAYVDVPLGGVDDVSIDTTEGQGVLVVETPDGAEGMLKVTALAEPNPGRMHFVRWRNCEQSPIRIEGLAPGRYLLELSGAGAAQRGMEIVVPNTGEAARARL